MSSYEEKVVDGEVVDAWKGFRTRLADALEVLEVGAAVVLEPEVGPHVVAPQVRVEREPKRLVVRLCAEGDLETPYRPDAEGRGRIVGLGFRLRESEPRLHLAVDAVDRAAHAAAVVLHEVWEVLHPTFLTCEGAELVERVVPESSEVVVPDVVELTDPDDLARWVDTVLTPEFGHAPVKRPNGDIGVDGQRGTNVTVSVRDGGRRVEVWTFLVEEVSFKKAHRAIDRLAAQHSDVRFFLVRDDLVAGITVPGDPFAPQQLVNAMNRLLRLSHDLRWLAPEVERKRARRARAERPDADLMALYATVWTKEVDAARLAVDLSSKDVDVLHRWWQVVRAMRDEAAAADPGEKDSLRYRAAQTHRAKLRRLDSCLRRARDQVVAGTVDVDQEAS